MDFSTRRASIGESNIVPMINVVFLLLIFFLMTAEITPPPPFDINLPVAAGAQQAEKGAAIQISAGGELAYQGLRGEAAYAALAATPTKRPVLLYADASLAGKTLARALRRLAGAGIRRVNLISVRR